MDNTTLAFLIFACSHPEALEQVRALTEAEATEAGEPLPDLRETMIAQILSAEAKAQGVSLDALIREAVGPTLEHGEKHPASNPDVPGLEKYNRMRDFEASPEPSGIAKSSRTSKRSAPQALQFCVQKHDATRLHYDFRLELDGTLKSWAIPKGPCFDPKVKRLSVHVEDHPLEYATFEGSIPQGHYGAGDVIVWDRGMWIPQGDPAEAYRKGRLKFELRGEKLSGLWNLVRTHIEGKQEQWFLIKHQDEAARPLAEFDVVSEQPNSVLSDRTIIPRKRGRVRSFSAEKTSTDAPALMSENAKSAPLPETLAPQLATLVEASPQSEDWRYEIKFDGYRMLCRVDGADIRLLTRNGHDWTLKLPRQATAVSSLDLESAWLDGEIVITDESGLPSFQMLQNAFDAGKNQDIVYYLFDLPYLNGLDLRDVPVEVRRKMLKQVMEKSTDPILRFSEDFTEDVDGLMNSACQMRMEGLIGKRLGSSYVSRRSDSWIKLKCKHRQEFVIVGYTDPKGARSGFGALVLALTDQASGELRHAGKVGTGFTEATLATILQTLLPLEQKKVPVVNPPKGVDARGIHWLKPTLLAEVTFAEITSDGVVRHAVFQGIRTDKPAKDITIEQPAPVPKAATRAKTTAMKAPSGKVRITHPERVIDPGSGLTKRDLAEYYAQVSPWLLPHLKDRPIALVRAPDGITGELFFQKNADRLAIPNITTVPKADAGKAGIVINSVEALVGAVQMSTIELHSWNGTTEHIDQPDRFVLDLDPDPALPWKAMVEATQLTLVVLDELGLESFLKTSGGKGIHIMVPLTPEASWEEVKSFSQAVVKYIAKLIPDRFSAVLGPRNRIGKIFIDYLRNSKGATTANVYAARAREGLPVSVPIFREEIADLQSAAKWNITNLHERLDELAGDDPWSEMATTRQLISSEMKQRIGMKQKE
ncbi:Multifunctional non-homologous end joining protein LigD [Pseudomonas fluorescens]|uniref:DNA ligase D n=1 Tax=Pseudomonas fluorescens TaxID=294 RepID=UPI0012565153|nr:DNA ligase D [Pseudomonas fluorescens]CAG8868738.1 Multifunctional non-homologous end joining protein LigD [Pseudomonas fluorescens]VVP68547.1 Multifunctional non-homologous end joining protein LigD [Pseudomonas fluorescens]